MNDFSAHTVRLLLDLLYGATKPRLTLAEAVALFKVSDKYSVMGLHQQCTRVLKLMLSLSNMHQLQRLADRHHCSQLSAVSSHDAFLVITVCRLLSTQTLL